MWIDGISGLVSDVQEHERRDADDHALCGEASGAGVAKYERACKIEIGG